MFQVFACEPDEFECNYPADGCLPEGKVFNGIVDCLRDGHDETETAREWRTERLIPWGKQCRLLHVATENHFYTLEIGAQTLTIVILYRHLAL